MKQAYISMSDLAWEKAGNPDFDKLKTGYEGEGYRVVQGVPATAKLKQVIYVFEDESLPDIPADELFRETPWTLFTQRRI